MNVHSIQRLAEKSQCPNLAAGATQFHLSIRRFPSQRDLARRMREQDFERVGWRNMTLGVVALHTGWRI